MVYRGALLGHSSLQRKVVSRIYQGRDAVAHGFCVSRRRGSVDHALLNALGNASRTRRLHHKTEKVTFRWPFLFLAAVTAEPAPAGKGRRSAARRGEQASGLRSSNSRRLHQKPKKVARQGGPFWFFSGSDS